MGTKSEHFGNVEEDIRRCSQEEKENLTLEDHHGQDLYVDRVYRILRYCLRTIFTIVYEIAFLAGGGRREPGVGICQGD